MNDNRQIRVAISQGDTNGIGYELIFKVFSSPEMFELCTPIIYGSANIADFHRQILESDVNYSVISSASEAKEGRINLLNVVNDEIHVAFGTPSEEAGRAALTALDKAIADFTDHKFDVLITTPANTESLKLAGQDVKNQLNYVAQRLASHNQVMNILVNDFIRIGIFSDNVDTKTEDKTTTETLTENIEQLALTLKRDFRLSNPRIAILTAPSASTTEKDEIIRAVIEELEDKKTNVFGPYTADTLYANSLYEHFDAILAMTPDQGKDSFLTLSPDNGVEIISGLPLVCVQPIQDTSYDIAGKNIANESQLRQAIYLAIDTLRNRKLYDEPMANPLPKLYHEKRDESEKVRFSIPKKHEHSNTGKNDSVN